MADINLLALNLGNSRLGLGVFVEGNLDCINKIPHAARADWPAVIAQAWDKIKDRSNPAVAAASVNPPLQEPLEKIVKDATGTKIEWLGKDIDLPMKISTQEPGKLGTDRILNLAAAYEQMQKSCVVVDAGTAITIDVCNDAGEFLGGAIAPGASMMLKSMHEKTAQLPSVSLEIPDGLIGKTTQQAMLHGVYHGIRGMVKELVENYATELGHWPDIIATGGDADKLFAGWELIHAVSPDLTLYGLALAYAEHHIKHG